ncbi:hypothetical protein BJ165DRAFT_1434489 [Panaeolus papilionaceus]|nr:hypothetical protein BJ165DRAFT_1434489 [Panaeolus papilionaceus]
MATSLLPPFLEPLPTLQSSNSSCVHAKFIHPNTLGSSHALWWHPHDVKAPIDLILLFLPGNPGLADFYIPFLDKVFAHHTQRKNIVILAHSHLDHSPNVPNPSDGYLPSESLAVQIQASFNVLEALHSYAEGAKVLVFGHSVGSWIALEVFKRAEKKVSALFLLTPTISYIGSTPNGRKLTRIFSPALRSVLGALCPLAHYIPPSIFRALFSTWPAEQLAVLRQFVSSSSCVLASLCMAHEEMKTIKEPDFKFLQKTSDRLYFYYAENDDWVGNEKCRILDKLDPTESSSSVVRGPSEVPHAFCINHSDIVADQCNHWISHLIDM